MRVFVSGLTGSLGTSLALLHHSRGDQVWGCARSEAGAVRWLAEHGRAGTLFLADAFRLGDDCTDAGRALLSCDRLYHCAAMKHVDLCEANPHEAAYQNVAITQGVASACAALGVPMVFISSDKACLPGGVYGATKLIAERAVTRAGGAAVRLGNLIGSQGSVFGRWRQAKAKGEPIRLTDPEMTRYFVSVEDAAAFVADRHLAGKVVIPHPMRAARMGDLAEATGLPALVTGPRPGETRHQWLVAPGECVKYDEGRLTLGEGETLACGLSSDQAAWWDARELLEAGGFF